MTVTQLDIFEPRDARLSDPPTSHAAAAANRESRSKHRALALRVLRDNPEGLTDFELESLTGVKQTSIGKRRKDLEREGLVEPVMVAGPDGPIQLRRQTPSGASAGVWRAVA